jgi:uncharacterized protein (TIGR02231 family)
MTAIDTPPAPVEVESAPARGVELPIVSVVVLEDRAAITRRGRVVVPAGEGTLRVDRVAPILANKTVTARITSGGAILRDVRVRRVKRILDASLPEEKRRLADELASLRDLADRRRRELALAEAEDAALARTEALASHEIGEDVAWGRLDADRVRAGLNRLVRARVELAEKIARMEVENRELDAEIERKRARIAADPPSKMEAWIEIDAGATTEETCDIEVSYVVPNACWRPQHTATLHAGAASTDAAPPEKSRVLFACEGTVWQNTGEDWVDAQIALSTERPSLGAEPPVLEADLLDVVPRSATVHVEMRDQTLEEAGLGIGAGRAGGPPPGLPGIDDGGSARHIPSPDRHTIPSDGRPHRIPLFSFECEPKT